jgi:hypothetical protein
MKGIIYHDTDQLFFSVDSGVDFFYAFCHELHDYVMRSIVVFVMFCGEAQNFFKIGGWNNGNI